MRRLLLALAVLALAACSFQPALAQSTITPFIASSNNTELVGVTASSGNVAAASATATLPAGVGRTTYICGFALTSAGSTAAAVVNPTVTNVVGGTQTFVYTSVAGATLANPSLVVNYSPCQPATAVNTTIVVTLPSLGAGNTNAAAVAWGYQGLQ